MSKSTLFTITWLLAAASLSETNATKIIVSARGYAAPLTSTPGGTGLIESRAVFKAQPVSVSDLGRYVPGVSRNADGAWGADINIRGLSRDSVVVLIDGARVETANNIAARLGLIDPLTVERIEILKGPVSSLYGSGSIGGVVNIITKGADFSSEPRPGGGVSVQGKSNPEGFGVSAWGSWTATNDFLYAAQTVRDFKSYEDGDGRTMQNSQFRDRQTTVKAGHRLTGSQTLKTQVQYYEGKDIGVPAGGEQLPAAGQWVTYPVTRRGLFDIAHIWNPPTGNWDESELKLYWHFNDRRAVIDRFPAAVRELRAGADHDTFGGRWQNRIQLDSHTLVAGADVWQRNYDGYRQRELLSGTVISDKPLPDCSFLSAGGFAEDRWIASDRLTLSGGARADWIRVRNEAVIQTFPLPTWTANTEDDVSWNAHLGATYALNEALSAKGIVARGYRAANLEERFSYISLAGGGVLEGDPALDPEESLFTEWGLDWNGDRLRASASVFVNRLDNLIIVRNTGGVDQRYANVREAEIAGVETEADWRLSEDWTLYGSLSWLNGRDTGAGDDLPDIAPLNGLFGVRGKSGAGLWGALETEFAARQNQTPSGTDEAAGWQTVNARVGYDFAAGKTKHTLYLGADNLLDESYNNYLSTSRSGSVILYEPGRSFSAAWKVEL